VTGQIAPRPFGIWDIAIDGLFDTGYHLKHVDTIFRRVFGE
jgi:hypothetical protein